MGDWATPAVVAALFSVCTTNHRQGIVSVFLKLLGTALYACTGVNELWFRWTLVGFAAVYEAVGCLHIPAEKPWIPLLFLSLAFGVVAIAHTHGSNAFAWIGAASWIMAGFPWLYKTPEKWFKIESNDEVQASLSAQVPQNDSAFKFMF